jgi:hypothetical protein
VTAPAFEAGRFYERRGSMIMIVDMSDGPLGLWTSPHIPTRPLADQPWYRPEDWTEISEEEFWGEA